MNKSDRPSTRTIFPRAQKRSNTKTQAMAHVVKEAAMMLGARSSWSGWDAAGPAEMVRDGVEIIENAPA